jgi:hypothetical protein
MLPVSSLGKKPLGTTMNKTTLRTIDRIVTAKVARRQIITRFSPQI